MENEGSESGGTPGGEADGGEEADPRSDIAVLGAFRLDPGKVVHETIDDETILIDLETGTYFSLSGPGTEIWDMFVGGVPLLDVIEQVIGRYEGDPSVIGRSIRDLAGELCRSGLLEPCQPPTGGPPRYHSRSAPPRGPAYVAPVLHTYRDMEYFLLLDPVHDVDEVGWPHAPDAPAPSTIPVESAAVSVEPDS